MWKTDVSSLIFLLFLRCCNLQEAVILLYSCHSLPNVGCIISHWCLCDHLGFKFFVKCITFIKEWLQGHGKLDSNQDPSSVHGDIWAVMLIYSQSLCFSVSTDFNPWSVAVTQISIKTVWIYKRLSGLHHAWETSYVLPHPHGHWAVGFPLSDTAGLRLSRPGSDPVIQSGEAPVHQPENQMWSFTPLLTSKETRPGATQSPNCEGGNQSSEMITLWNSKLTNMPSWSTWSLHPGSLLLPHMLCCFMIA